MAADGGGAGRRLRLKLAEGVADNHRRRRPDVRDLLTALGVAAELAWIAQERIPVEWPPARETVQQTCLALFDELCRAHSIPVYKEDESFPAASDDEPLPACRVKAEDDELSSEALEENVAIKREDCPLTLSDSTAAAVRREMKPVLKESNEVSKDGNVVGADDGREGEVGGGESAAPESREVPARKNADCKVCHAQFAQASSLRGHMRSAHRDWPCQYCPQTFTSRRNLRLHLVKHENGCEMFSCETCDKSFYRVTHLRRHARTKHPVAVAAAQQPKYPCNSCDQAFQEIAPLRKHKASAHGESKDVQCDSCAATFFTVNGLRRHKRATHEGSRDHQCEKCPKRFLYPSSLRKHTELIHEGIRKENSMCGVCGKTFTCDARLKDHNATVHEGVARFACQECQKRYFTKEELRRHTKTTHVERVRKEQCKFCPAAYFEPNHLQKHIDSIHLKLKPHTCEICGMNFARSGSMTAHIKFVHEKVKRFRCDVCQLSLSKMSQYKKHLESKTHLLKAHEPTCDLPDHINCLQFPVKAKTHGCELCGKSFSDKYQTLLHIKMVHKKERPYKCELCNKFSSTKANHKVHLRSLLHQSKVEERTQQKRAPTKHEAIVAELIDEASVAVRYVIEEVR